MNKDRSDYHSMPAVLVVEMAKHSDNEFIIALGELLGEALGGKDKYEKQLEEKADEVSDLETQIEEANEIIGELEDAVSEIAAALDTVTETLKTLKDKLK